MKLIIHGDVNKYYVQMLCMIYFPGAKFGKDEQETADNPTLELKVTRNEQGVDAYAELRYMHKICSSQKHADFSEGMTHDRTQKIVIGEAVLAAAGVKFMVLYVLVVKIICGAASGALLGKKLGDIVVLAPPMLEMLPAMFAWPQLFTALIGGAIALLIAPALRKALHR